MLAIAVIFLTLTTTSCTTIPTTPRIELNDKPTVTKFTGAELAELAKCTKGKWVCVVSRSIILKLDDHILAYRADSKECRAAVEANNRKAK